MARGGLRESHGRWGSRLSGLITRKAYFWRRTVAYPSLLLRIYDDADDALPTLSSALYGVLADDDDEEDEEDDSKPR